MESQQNNKKEIAPSLDVGVSPVFNNAPWLATTPTLDYRPAAKKLWGTGTPFSNDPGNITGARRGNK